MSTEVGGSGWLPPGFVAAYRDPALAREFREHPQGPYSDRLAALLAIMRRRPVGGKPVFVLGSDGTSQMAEIPARFGDPLTPVGAPFSGFPGPDEEIAAFAVRWRAVFGEEVPA